MSHLSNEPLWVERYRPQKVADCILLPDLKQTFQKIVDSGDVPNMILTGGPGLGKTTVAKAICNELGLDFILINASQEGNIDTLRTKIKHFASTVSLQGGRKVVILDEGDYLNPQSTQPALRGFIEEFSRNCAFIITCNYLNKLIEPLHSRCSVYRFDVAKKDMPKLASQFTARIVQILEIEKVDHDKKAVMELISKYMPDWRRVINELQRYASTGAIDAGVLVNLTDTNFSTLVKALKERNFKVARQWVADNGDISPAEMFRALYDRANDHIEPASVPQLVLILADYQYKAAFVADQELNTMACFTEVMSEVNFK